VSQPPKPTELVFLSKSSVLPALTAIGIAAVVIGLFTWWPYTVVGAAIALLSLNSWLRSNRDDIGRMPRRQRTDTAPIPLSVSRPSD
jgi:hypothetical protein